ncbi:MAG: hypothetical protein MRQ11_02620 [Candidatus Midichloria mitochondrii]|uniref:hypothetical protein n=1 Tax=Candidatus Midichloria mitochondrii TaxID=234827 RepID=UPI00030E5A6F|nr:hypothetical protein [Candidatus Midichloria mitochondrii]MDJ1256270.1 hypothetical protein [Candidatus Midichloria mitochondrii]MDJ1288638.1 hypothetical protein [Candidatus Midichloria mitochondrii]MDJ1298812.1 hypothetical protein [Candidatus Midichloria mitochondrii]MDJ1313018.1 hypothetical protein [Candidatus Midichloria mitochondrii]MDJ1583573.1 hypothetical protein [Candidatus Midichloria mitochondrii]
MSDIAKEAGSAFIATVDYTESVFNKVASVVSRLVVNLGEKILIVPKLWSY